MSVTRFFRKTDQFLSRSRLTLRLFSTASSDAKQSNAHFEAFKVTHMKRLKQIFHNGPFGGVPSTVTDKVVGEIQGCKSYLDLLHLNPTNHVREEAFRAALLDHYSADLKKTLQECRTADDVIRLTKEGKLPGSTPAFVESKVPALKK